MNSVSLSMSLGELFDGYTASTVDVDKGAAALTLDSRNCIEHCVYFAMHGLTTHGLLFIEDVLDKSPAAVVVDANDSVLTEELAQKISKHCELILVVNLSANLGAIASRFYKTNSDDCRVVAVTGTDGKTSVSHFVAQALNHAGSVAGLLGTAGWGFPNSLQTSALTTPDVLEVHRQLYLLRKAGARFVCMEVSSHALEQGRVDGVEFAIAVLTNLARDHLDFHGSLENYANAKRKLFLKDNLQVVILNSDDNFGQKLLADTAITAQKLSYGKAHSSSYRIDAISSTQRGLNIRSERAGELHDLQTGLLGGFNAYNVLATWAVLEVLGVSLNKITDALSALTPVIGRMEKFSHGNGPTVVVDFAHTPQALELALGEVKKHCDGNVWCVFGCGGDRDKGKRSKMGLAAVSVADFVVVTNDNPRTEDPIAISEDILSGIEDQTSVVVMLDRESAIRHSLSQAASNDWVVVAGKGHEDYQIFGQKRVQFSDRDVVQRLLAEAV